MKKGWVGGKQGYLLLIYYLILFCVGKKACLRLIDSNTHTCNLMWMTKGGHYKCSSFFTAFISFLSALSSLKKIHCFIVETEDIKQILKIAKQL